VIDVGPSDGSEEPYLYVRKDGQRDRYLTLSHRWGSSTSLEATKTMKANLTLNTMTISFSSLPLTFQHAIIITRRFGYRYLWIDSLCIIQDDEDDWMVESEKMGEIYRKADFTIATIDAMGADSGCFFPRDGQTLRPCRLDIYRPPRQEDTYASHTGKIFASRVVDLTPQGPVTDALAPLIAVDGAFKKEFYQLERLATANMACFGNASRPKRPKWYPTV
jgi:hypothetical protein